MNESSCSAYNLGINLLSFLVFTSKLNHSTDNFSYKYI
jgi:hypothetical protein